MWVCDTNTASIGRRTAPGVRSMRPRSIRRARPCHRRFRRSAGSPVWPFRRRGRNVVFMEPADSREAAPRAPAGTRRSCPPLARSPERKAPDAAVFPAGTSGLQDAPMPGPRALIFDFDGVIADSEPLHLTAFQAALAREGITLTTEEYYAGYLGFDDHDAIVEALQGAGQAPAPDKVRVLMTAKADAFLDLVRSAPRIFPGVQAFVRAAGARVPLAIASGALRHEIELILGQVGLADAFAGIVSAEDVTAGKPSPEGFLRARDLLA